MLGPVARGAAGMWFGGMLGLLDFRNANVWEIGGTEVNDLMAGLNRLIAAVECEGIRDEGRSINKDCG